jgi:predicted nucleotidyltransferase
MLLLEQLRAQKSELLSLAERCGLGNIKVFGSVARGEETPESDIDFLVDYRTGSDPLGFVDFQDAVSVLTKRKVDIVFEKGLSHLLRDRIHQEAVPL